ncbi:MAG: Ribosome maturation factor RimM [Alphaproteobacteria bacterium ADurb.Bin438]|nr:MAG: Ribosome maturation factor RimM [Alphaproteobacteria bacterium ADurb.Bin438]
MSNSFQKNKMVCVCQVASAHGVKGEVKLFSFMEDRLNIKSYPVLFDEDGKSYEVKVTGLFKEDLLIARLNDNMDRNVAEELRGKKLYVNRDNMPDLEEEEYYHADLIGLEVVTTDGENLGIVSAIHNFGAGDILEVKKGQNSLMLPFTKKVVLKIDFDNGQMISIPLKEIFLEQENDKEGEEN